MAVDRCPHSVLIAKLESRHALDDDDRAAIRTLGCETRWLDARSVLTLEGGDPTRCCFLLSGFAFRHKSSADGARQILGLLIPGDFTDLQQLVLPVADHTVETLSRAEVADIPSAALVALSLSRPAIAKAIWIETLVEGSIAREMLLNNGRRTAVQRVAHFLCEFELRMNAAGLSFTEKRMPMTQEQLGDATALTSVHVNRTLKELARDGLIEQRGRQLRILDWSGLREQAGFLPDYLHLRKVADGRAGPRHTARAAERRPATGQGRSTTAVTRMVASRSPASSSR